MILYNFMMFLIELIFCVFVIVFGSDGDYDDPNEVIMIPIDITVEEPEITIEVFESDGDEEEDNEEENENN